MSEQILPSIQYINGHPYIRVRDLANAWHTTTSTILATGKPQQVPAEYRRMIDREAWVDVEGLRIRVGSMKPGSNLAFQLKQLVDRFPEDEKHVDDGLGPQVETIHGKDGSITITRCFLQRIDYPSQEEIHIALDNKQVLWRYQDKRIQVLAQTLSSFLDTRTSSLLAVNKKQGVPAKFIHREWKRTWVDLEGLKKRVENTEHGSALLKGLKQVIGILDDYKAAYTRPLSVEESASASAASSVVNASSATKSKQKKQADCPAVTLASRNSRDIADLSTQLYDQSQRVTDNRKRIHGLEKRVDAIEATDKQAVQAMREKKTPFDALSRRVNGMASHVDRLDGKTEGLTSRVSVVEDTSRWLSWTLAGVIGLRFVGLTLRWLRRK